MTRTTVDSKGLGAFLVPRSDLLREREAIDGSFEAAEGPVEDYERRVEVRRLPDGRHEITQTVHFKLAVPYAGWLFVLPFRHAIARPPRAKTPWWAPPVLLDFRSSSVLGTLA
ncbi:MAG: hypothetical protein LC713_06315, partial [Actinobacteria bacterium]|nr:hypothetical protein [Actinomycetota bacterium]